MLSLISLKVSALLSGQLHTDIASFLLLNQASVPAEKERTKRR